MSLFAQIRDYIDSLVHASARPDPLAAARHRAFIAPRLVGGLFALTALPIHLAIGGRPGMLEILFYAWLATPILVACYLSRTGRYEREQLTSSVSLAALVSAVAMATGGITSFAAVWLVVVPLEAALSASRRVVTAASAVALAAAGLLYLIGPQALAAFTPSPVLTTFGIISAALYATGLALGSASLARTGSRLLMVEEDRYRLLARNITDVITRHRRNGTVRFASPAAESLFGVPARALLGHGLFDRVHVGDRPAYLKALADAATQLDSSSVEFRIRRETPPDSDRPAPFIWVEMRCRALDRAEGESAQTEREVVAVMRDVTDRKAQEHAVEDAREEAERANAAKSRFLATMSHELRTPLNAIIGFSEMLANEEPMQLDKSRRHEYATLIGESGQHLLSVVNGILDMSKIESGNFEITPEPFAPAPVIGTCCDLMALRAREAGIDLVCRVPADLPDIVADKRAVKQILINLLSNAIKFTQRGGRVSVRGELSGAEVVFTVEDTGVGIGEDDLRHVGDPFFQVRTAYDRPHDGTGLGLSIVKGLIELHGGELSMRSRLGSGTSVSVRLPIDCEQGRVVDAPSNVERLPLPEPVVLPAETRVRKRA
ncbi:MAG: PAS domain S-box protein [Alphaproteobacteria bacterium]|nr:MAG: PAS domain S-box protein [Alphaproteobacteria bacterium]